MRQYVIIVDHAEGNERVGEMWHETRIFDGDATLDEVMNWANPHNTPKHLNSNHSRNNIKITRPWSPPEDSDETT